mgnify:CR=1 FL=1
MGGPDPNHWVDTTDVLSRKVKALLCHVSQLGETGEWLRQVVHQRAEEGGRVAGVPYAVKDNIDVAGLPTNAGFGSRCGVMSCFASVSAA